MRRRVRWHDRRNESFSGSALRPVQRSSALLRRRPWIGLSNESETSRDEQKGRQHRNDDGGTGSVSAGLANLLRLLRNAAGADISHPMGPIAITGGYVAAVENTAPSASCSVSTEGSSATGQQYRRQRPWSLVPRSGKALPPRFRQVVFF